ncbi:uncharacterized protein LOC115696388 [Cannabis sativa]|uniref:uncharacterized protein LOC115696388 n=1 Tax=Cannabis sativa TaxID=3483 RepID=UPI0029CA9704|nr:uncharacterized protein LOC115696388 [Cannabis sativa]
MAQSSFTLPLAGDGAMERLRSRKQKTRTTPSVEKEAVTTAAPSCPSARAQKKNNKRPSPVESTDWLSNTVDLSFPSSAAAHSEFGLHLGEASKLLFPEDRARFENIGEIASMELSISRSFQGMQGLMYALDKIKNMKEQMKDMRTERDTLRGEIKELKSCKKELDRVREELRTQLDAKEQDSNRLKSALADLATAQARVDMLEGRLAEIGLEAEIQCRGKMAMEYRDNKAESWDIPQYIADYEELLRMRAEEDARTSQLANSFEEMTTNDLPVDDSHLS